MPAVSEKTKAVWIIHPFPPCSPSDYTPLNSYLHPFAQAHSSQALTTAVTRAFACLIMLHQHDDAFPGCPYNFRIMVLFSLFWLITFVSSAQVAETLVAKVFLFWFVLVCFVFLQKRPLIHVHFTLWPVWKASDLISFFGHFLIEYIYVGATLEFNN